MPAVHFVSITRRTSGLILSRGGAGQLGKGKEEVVSWVVDSLSENRQQENFTARETISTFL